MSGLTGVLGNYCFEIGLSYSDYSNLKVARMLDLAEYKRRQAAPGVKVTRRNFGRDRRYPIVNRFRDSGAPLAAPDRSLLKGGEGAAKSEAFDF